MDGILWPEPEGLLTAAALPCPAHPPYQPPPAPCMLARTHAQELQLLRFRTLHGTARTLQEAASRLPSLERLTLTCQPAYLLPTTPTYLVKAFDNMAGGLKVRRA